MILTIIVMVAITVAVVFAHLAPRIATGRIIFSDLPDRPVAFGLGVGWLAVRSRDTAAVVEALGLDDPHPCNWNSGIGTVYDAHLGETHVYVTPPVNGWTFVVGLSLPHPAGRGFADKCTPMLVGLSGRFIEIQYFYSCPNVDLFAWARVLDGRLVRAFAVGDEGVIWSKGKTTKEERSLGLKLFELRGVRGRRGDAGGELILHPTEEHVCRLAGRWSIDPTSLDATRGQPALGVIALSPRSWRAERLKRSA